MVTFILAWAHAYVIWIYIWHIYHIIIFIKWIINVIWDYLTFFFFHIIHNLFIIWFMIIFWFRSLRRTHNFIFVQILQWFVIFRRCCLFVFVFVLLHLFIKIYRLLWISGFIINHALIKVPTSIYHNSKPQNNGTYPYYDNNKVK